jgi:hypothetical protein
VSKDLLCPKCGEPQTAEMVAKLSRESEVVFTLRPAPNELLGAHTVGGSIDQVAKLLAAVWKEIGVPTEVLVRRVETAEDGTISATLIVCRFDEALRIRKRRKDAQAGEAGTAETPLGGSVHEHAVATSGSDAP